MNWMLYQVFLNFNNFTPDKSESPVCGSDCGNPATGECLTCQAAFCDECYNLIHSKSAFKAHERVELGKLNEIKPGVCNYHKKEIELFCNTCQTVISLFCSHCILCSF